MFQKSVSQDLESQALKILTETKWFLCGATTVQEFRLHEYYAMCFFFNILEFLYSLTFTLTFGDIETIIVFFIMCFILSFWYAFAAVTVFSFFLRER